MPTKIALADLAHTYSVSDRALTVPLGIGYVKAYAVEALKDEVEIDLFKHPERFLNAVHEKRPSIIGFANYGWNENLNREVGRHVRQLLPEALIVAGGPNIDPATDRRMTFLQRHDYLDYLIVDGGEEAFTELVQWHLGGRTGQLPSNIVWRDAEGLHATSERPLKKIIEHLPSPYLSHYLDEFLEAGMVPLFETNRGCPFRCTFCAWGSASKDLVRRIDFDQAIAEIAYVGDRSDASNWIVCDANFGILPRDIDIAKAIRKVKDEHGHPSVCHIWLAKNVTDRNLIIGEIMSDMIHPVMAVQSLDDDVLKHIKRDNISIDTYEKYQKKFQRMGSRTYSDLIVPLPGETIETHLSALRTLMSLGVDIIANHNMRMLAGAETNSAETRETFKFKTRYRLIHGDAGEYRAPTGEIIRAFEYEESLRSTSTMTEEDVFYLRKLHFLVDFCWNIEVYRPLLGIGELYGINPMEVMVALLESEDLVPFFAEFDTRSQAEWFDSAEHIEAYFERPENWSRLLNKEFEKLNIQFSVIALRDYKVTFDRAVERILTSFDAIPVETLREACKVTFALFPALNEAAPAGPILVRGTALHLSETKPRARLRAIISSEKSPTLSKVLNTQGATLRDLRLVVAEDFRFDHAFRRD